MVIQKEENKHVVYGCCSRLGKWGGFRWKSLCKSLTLLYALHQNG
jgi:hypothetical protein